MRRSVSFRGAGLWMIVALGCGQAGEVPSRGAAEPPAQPLANSPEAAAVVAELRARYVRASPPPAELPPPYVAPVTAPVPHLAPAPLLALASRGGALVPELAPLAAGTGRAEVGVEVRLPRSAEAPLTVRDEASDVGVAVVARGVSPAPAELAADLVVYRDAHGAGAHVVLRVDRRGVEEFVRLPATPATPRLDYELELTGAAAGLRLVAGTLEVLDAGGAPRLRVPPPYLVGADGRVHPASLDVSGCAHDVDPRGPWGRAVVAPGSPRCVVSVAWERDAVLYPALLDPAWTATTGSMATAREHHTATRLGGKVLVTGGAANATTGEGVVATAELWNSADGTWAATGSLTEGRYDHVAVTIPGGLVLVAGGLSAPDAELASAELYDENTGLFEVVPPMSVERGRAAAALLKDDRVLVTGGAGADGAPLDSSEMFNAVLKQWFPVGPGTMQKARQRHTATSLNDGRVLLVGGTSTLGEPMLDCEVFEGPESGVYFEAAPLVYARQGHTAIHLQDDDVLVVGGRLSLALEHVERYRPASNTWISQAKLNKARLEHGAALLSSGHVLVAGGVDPSGAPLRSTERFDLAQGKWELAGDMTEPRRGLTLVALDQDRAFAAGGFGTAALASSETFQTLAIGDACTGHFECTSGFCVDGVCCNSACPRQCEACDVEGSVGTCVPVAGAPHGTRTPCTSDQTECGGTCDGTNPSSCSYLAQGTPCGTRRCTLDQHGAGTAYVQRCTGFGSCKPEPARACAPYGCADNDCKSSCESEADCAPDHLCESSICRPDEGCGCRTVGRSGAAGGAPATSLAALFLGALFGARRRRRSAGRDAG